jgi:hypothetical protein
MWSPARGLARWRAEWARMLSPEVARAAFRWAIFIVLGALGLLVVLTPGSPEFAITLVTLLIGLVFVGIVVACVRLLG